MSLDDAETVLVVFVHGTATGRPWWAAWLPMPTWSHCFVVAKDHRANAWLEAQMGWEGITFVVLAPLDFDAAAYYTDLGHTVVEAERWDFTPRWPWMMNTCVGATKRILGVVNPFILTPAALLRHLVKDKS